MSREGRLSGVARRWSFVARGTAGLLALLGGTPLAAQVPEKYENRVLAIPALAGQTVAVLPLTSLIRDSTIASDTTLGPWGARATGIKRFDALLGSFLEDNIVDTKWVMPEELRKMSKRSGGYLPDPDFIGHAALWNPRIEKKVPDPVQSRLRSVAAISGARSILVPVGTHLARDTSGLLTAQVGLLIVDARIGDIRWRTYTTGKGPTPDAAVRSALMASLPVDALSQ